MTPNKTACISSRPPPRIGLEPRHGYSGRHLEPLQHLSCSRIDSPQIALVTFPGAELRRRAPVHRVEGASPRLLPGGTRARMTHPAWCAPWAGVLDYALARVGAAAGCHSGLLRCSVKDENMMLKLMLILSLSLALASTECCR